MSAKSTVRFHCTSCNKHLQVGAEFAGKRARCPGCHLILHIPSEQAGGAERGLAGGAPQHGGDARSPCPAGVDPPRPPHTTSGGSAPIQEAAASTPEPEDSEVRSLAAMLGRRNLFEFPVHFIRLLELGRAVVPSLLPLLDSDEDSVVCDAASLLGHLGAVEAAARLEALAHSDRAEVCEACRNALATLRHAQTCDGNLPPD